jgi:multicomponent K+:H+ antiporter subunit F
MSYALAFAIGCFAIGLVLNLIRLLTAPNATDRILAVDTMVLNVIALLVLYGIKIGSTINFEAALLLALTGFVATIAYCTFVLRVQR